jgi:hypothetical protein
VSEYLRLPDGREIHAGKCFRDLERETPHLLRVKSIGVPRQDWAGHLHYLVTCEVVRCEPDGECVVLRGTTIDAERLLDLTQFVPVKDDDAEGGL